MNDKRVTLKYNAEVANSYSDILTGLGSWELTIVNPLLGEQTIVLPNDIAMAVAIAIATASEAGREDGERKGYTKAKKKYQTLNKIASGKYSHIFAEPSEAIDKDYWKHDAS
jgi:hypothetical protein